jgi:hypothetical protein
MDFAVSSENIQAVSAALMAFSAVGILATTVLQLRTDVLRRRREGEHAAPLENTEDSDPYRASRAAAWRWIDDRIAIAKQRPGVFISQGSPMWRAWVAHGEKLTPVWSRRSQCYGAYVTTLMPPPTSAATRAILRESLADRPFSQNREDAANTARPAAEAIYPAPRGQEIPRGP